LLPAETESQQPNYESQFELLSVQVCSHRLAIEWQIGIWIQALQENFVLQMFVNTGAIYDFMKFVSRNRTQRAEIFVTLEKS
jgi:hypothetical protein